MEKQENALIDCLVRQGVSITSRRIHQILDNITATYCQKFNDNGVVCRSPLQNGAFKAVSIDKLIQKSSSNTSVDPFNATTISVFQQSIDRDHTKCAVYI